MTQFLRFTLMMFLLPVSNARNLGIVVENDLKLDIHVNNICRAASFGLHKIGKIRHYLDSSTTEKLIHAFVSSHLDNCNSLLYGLPDSQISKLQRIQNSAARLITRSKSRDHITPILHELHWLPVKYRIMYKTLVLTYKCIHGFAPVYLQELVQLYQPTRHLRSSSKSLLVSTSTSTVSYGKRAFISSSSELWNNLPEYVKNVNTTEQFKSSLKTHLFRLCFDP